MHTHFSDNCEFKSPEGAFAICLAVIYLTVWFICPCPVGPVDSARVVSQSERKNFWGGDTSVSHAHLSWWRC